MADYYALEQIAAKLGIREAQIVELELTGLLHPKRKDGKQFFSFRQALDLQVAVRIARKQRITLERALPRLEEMHLCQ